MGTSVTEIGDSAFAVCTNLTSVTLPKSVLSIGELAFAFCTGLKSFTVDIANNTFSSKDGV
ncbi:MAG: leucine-rich repeat protein, partial [Verrucomicrobia bacterium]|nr:leucine-rich repeat protein [Verrucomicrobiota bacterium]